MLWGFLILGLQTPGFSEMERTYLTLAVIDLAGTREANVNVQERQSLTDVIRGVARKQLSVAKWIVLTRENIREQLDSGMDVSNCEDKCVVEVARKLKVDYIVSGAITRLGSELHVNMNYYDIDDIEIGNVKGSAWANGTDAGSLIAPLEKASDSMFISLGKLHPLEDTAAMKARAKANKEWDSRIDNQTSPKSFGVGLHWTPVFGLGVKKDAGNFTSPDLIFRSLSLEQKGVSGLQGVGLKFWMGEHLEATVGMQFGYYDVNLVADTTRYPLHFNLGRPLLAAKPYFSRYMADAAYLYSFNVVHVPPAVKFHAGGGLALSSSTKVMTPAFAESVVQTAIDNGTFNPQTGTNAEMVRIIDDAFKKEKAAIGGGVFAQLGARYRPLAMPFATYLDIKYHVLVLNPDPISGPDFTLELGAAFLF